MSRQNIEAKKMPQTGYRRHRPFVRAALDAPVGRTSHAVDTLGHRGILRTRLVRAPGTGAAICAHRTGARPIVASRDFALTLNGLSGTTAWQPRRAEQQGV